MSAAFISLLQTFGLATMLTGSIDLTLPADATVEAKEEPQIVAKTLDLDDCVALALRQSGLIGEAKAKVDLYKARLAQVESTYYPKLSALGYVAPMFTVEGRGGQVEVERRWKSFGDWGPYTRLEALLAVPFYGFGRIKAGKNAAKERVEVERAQVRLTENTVAQEVRRLYTLRLYALSILPALDNAHEIVSKAVDRAQELYDSASGEVTQVQIEKLRFGRAEIDRFTTIAEAGASLATAALKHTMGVDAAVPLQFSDMRLPKPHSGQVAELSLPRLLQVAAEQRPEWHQIHHGEKAALAWEDAERLANWPVLFVAGLLQAGWTPTRDDDPNPYHWDPFNEVFGGVALGFKWDLDPALASAKGDEAKATYKQVEALRQFASTGIPLQVRKAHQDLEQALALSGIAKQSVTSARKWMTFAAAAFGTGAGEARDILEGLVAYLQAKRAYYEHVRDFHLARAELAFATGSTEKLY